MQQYGLVKKYNGILLQLILLGIVAVGFAVTKWWRGFSSVLLGGSAWLVPQAYFIWKMHRVQGIFDDPKKMLTRFFYSEIIKLILSFGMIALILTTCPLSLSGFLSGYVLMVLMSLIVFLSYGIKND